MGKNFDYIIKNFNYGCSISDWLYAIKTFFGEEKTEEFCNYFINAQTIFRINDIRNLIETHSLAVYSMSNKEQLAVITVYVPVDRDIKLINNIGFKETQRFYRNKSMKLAQQIKQLGYSYSRSWCNWKDKNEKDIYQREYVFFVYSENDNAEQFKNNILNLAKEFKIASILITEPLKNKSPTLKIKSKLYDVATGEVLQEYADTTAETLEKYLSDISNTKVLFKIPYETNKTILHLEENTMYDYYSKKKQEQIKNVTVHSMNTGMLKQSLLKRFSNESYNS